ncbi:MAG: hypothetical protein IJR47_01555, partial [Clostridia bacterium]|nr:hypothetical protein [Clostridia bacterium]
MNRKKSIIVYLISFFMCLCLAFAATGAGVYFGFFNEGALIGAYSETESFNDVRETILDNINYADTPLNADRPLFESVITKEMVQNDVSEFIASAMNGREYAPEFEDFEKSYYSNFGGKLSEKNIIITKEADIQIEGYYDLFKAFYYEQIAKLPIGAFIWFKTTYFSSAIAILVIGCAGTAVCALLMYLTLKNRRNRIKLFAISFLSAGIITMLFPAYMFFTKSYLNLQIADKVNYDVAVKFASNGLITINIFGGLLLLFGVILAIT